MDDVTGPVVDVLTGETIGDASQWQAAHSAGAVGIYRLPGSRKGTGNV